MIEQLKFNLSLSIEQYKSLSAIKAWEGKHWSTPPNEDIVLIKAEIRRQLLANQGKCAYCGLVFKNDGDKQIEHIAAKSDKRPKRHPEFTFTLKNLVLACPACNCSTNKGTQETISVKHRLYSKCDFLIIHPYFDNPDDHYDWVRGRTQITIQVKNNSPKALASIKMFDLNSSGMTELRAGQYLIEKNKKKYPLSKRLNDMLQKALGK